MSSSSIMIMIIIIIIIIIISPGLKGRALTKSKIHQFHQNQSNVRRMRGRNILAVMKDVPIRYRKVEFV